MATTQEAIDLARQAAAALNAVKEAQAQQLEQVQKVVGETRGLKDSIQNLRDLLEQGSVSPELALALADVDVAVKAVEAGTALLGAGIKAADDEVPDPQPEPPPQ